MMTGMDTAAAPTASVVAHMPKKANKPDPMSVVSRSFRARQAVREVTGKSHAQGRIGAHLHVIDVLLPAAFLQLGDERLHLLQVTLAEAARVGEQFRKL